MTWNMLNISNYNLQSYLQRYLQLFLYFYISREWYISVSVAVGRKLGTLNVFTERHPTTF